MLDKLTGALAYTIPMASPQALAAAQLGNTMALWAIEAGNGTTNGTANRVRVRRSKNILFWVLTVSGVFISSMPPHTGTV